MDNILFKAEALKPLDDIKSKYSENKYIESKSPLLEPADEDLLVVKNFTWAVIVLVVMVNVCLALLLSSFGNAKPAPVVPLEAKIVTPLVENKPLENKPLENKLVQNKLVQNKANMIISEETRQDLLQELSKYSNF